MNRSKLTVRAAAVYSWLAAKDQQFRFVSYKIGPHTGFKPAMTTYPTELVSMDSGFCTTKQFTRNRFRRSAKAH